MSGGSHGGSHAGLALARTAMCSFLRTSTATALLRLLRAPCHAATALGALPCRCHDLCLQAQPRLVASFGGWHGEAGGCMPGGGRPDQPPAVRLHAATKQQGCSAPVPRQPASHARNVAAAPLLMLCGPPGRLSRRRLATGRCLSASHLPPAQALFQMRTSGRLWRQRPRCQPTR